MKKEDLIKDEIYYYNLDKKEYIEKFSHIDKNGYLVFTSSLNINDKKFNIYGETDPICDTPNIRLATEEEKQQLLTCIEANKYIDKPKIQLKAYTNKFKIGDKVKVIRKANDKEGDWRYDWVSKMDSQINKVLEVIETYRDNIGYKLLRGFANAIPGYLIYIVVRYLAFYEYWINKISGEDMLGIFILYVYTTPIFLIVTIILFVKGFKMKNIQSKKYDEKMPPM